ncbi:MAG: hypothetical protein M3395_00285 [Chloroflexota bacterium]|nr:hypothetical protein [Chloroflexota bacterium]
MPIWVIAVVLLIVGSVVLSQYAHRQVQGGDGRFAHLVFAPRLLVYGIMIAAGIRISFDQPIVGIPFTLGALVILGMYVRAGMRIARGARAGKTPDQMAGEILESRVEPVALYGILLLVGGFLAVIGLIVVAVAERLD